jgi:hypothetical protein
MELQAHEFNAPATETIASDELESLLAGVAPPPPFVPSVLLGVITGFDGASRPLVAYPGSSVSPLPALTTVALPETGCGREVALQFVGGDPLCPLIVGVIQPPGPAKPEAVEARVDGERVEFTAEKEIVFRCGKASLTLTRAGKVVIDGTHLLSRSSGANRIKGGSVQIN